MFATTSGGVRDGRWIIAARRWSALWDAGATSLFPGGGIHDANHEARDAQGFLDDKGQLRFERCIGRHIDVPHHLGITIEV